METERLEGAGWIAIGAREEVVEEGEEEMDAIGGAERELGEVETRGMGVGARGEVGVEGEISVSKSYLWLTSHEVSTCNILILVAWEVASSSLNVRCVKEELKYKQF